MSDSKVRRSSPRTDDKRRDTEVVSFRIARHLFESLEAYAKGKTDDAGVPLNASGAARRLLREAIESWEKTQKK